MGDFFHSVCPFDHRRFCKLQNDYLKRHFQEICSDINCHGESCLKRHPKNCIFFSTFGDCKFSEYCRYHHDHYNGEVQLKDNIEDVHKLKDEINQLKLDNKEKSKEIISEKLATKHLLEKVIKIEEELQNHKLVDKSKDNCIHELTSKISALESELSNNLANMNKMKVKFNISDKTVIKLDKRSLELEQDKYLLERKFKTIEDDMNKHKIENSELRVQNKKLVIFNNGFKKKLACVESIPNFQCSKCSFDSEDMDKIMEHMAVNHDEVNKEEWVESSTLAVDRCFICNNIF